MLETHNFVVLGGSSTGLNVAHSFLKYIGPELKKLGKTYHVYIVDRSSQFFWKTGSPRFLVSSTLLPADQLFVPIADGFKSYDSSLYTVVHGSAESWDVKGRTVMIELADGQSTRKLPYYALVLATGTSEVGHFLNGSAGWFSSRPPNHKAKVTLVTKSDKLLPVLSRPLALKAESFLNKVGVDVVYNVDVLESSSNYTDGKTTVNLSNGKQWTVDVHIPAYGSIPNSRYVPLDLKNSKGYIKTNSSTLRADAAGPRVYVAGDVGNCSRGGFHSLCNALPILVTNIKRDLLAAAASNDPNAKPEGPDRLFTANYFETQVVPIGPRGVGAVNGWWLPSFLVWLLKGRNYMIGSIPATVNGYNALVP